MEEGGNVQQEHSTGVGAYNTNTSNLGIPDPNATPQHPGGAPTSKQTIGLKTLLGDKKTYFMETSTFLTTVNPVEKGPKRIQDNIPKASEINMIHTQLDGLVNDLGIKISDVIKGHENDFFIAFKNKMYAIMKEMRELKEKASSERHKAKQEARLVNLEKERDWFRKEALKLDKMCKDHKRILNKLKATLENIEEDRDFFQEQLFNAKKVNKALLLELDRFKTGSQAQSQLQLQYSQPLAITNEEMERKDQGKYKVKEIKSKIDAVLQQNSEFGKFDLDDLKDDYIGLTNEYNIKEEDKNDQVAYQQHSPKVGLENDQQQLTAFEKHIQSQKDTVSIEEYRKIVRENVELKDKEQKYIDTIKHLKNQIDNEKKHARSLRADKVNFMTQRNELEEFFLQCVEEVRKDIVRRKTISTSYSNKKGMKKSTSQASMFNQQQLNSQQQQRAETAESLPNAKLEHFTQTDKRKVIELLMSNENVLLFLYEKLFPATSLSQQSTQSRGGTGQSQQNLQSVYGQPPPYKFVTDSGIPINTQSNNRSQTTVGGSRLHMKSSEHVLGMIGNDFNAITGAIHQSLPQATGPGMSVQNNIQNINLNINLAKGTYGSQQFLPQSKGNRGQTAPLGQQRAKKGHMAQVNAITNKYML